MIKLTNVKVPVDDRTATETIIAAKLGIKAADITEYRILRKSLDARKKGSVCYVYSFAVCVKGESGILKKNLKNVSPYDDKVYTFPYQNLSSDTRPVVVGTGPAGLFCALMLARSGLKPVVYDRGESVDNRTHTVEKFRNTGELNINSNVQFGEGGAGTFSDGKLTCGVNDVRTPFVLKEFVMAGAPEEILYSSKPHVGTDYLKPVVKNIRKEIEALGGEVNFNSCLTDFEIDDGRLRAVEITDVLTGDKHTRKCSCMIAALGHSSRDTYELFMQKGIEMMKKPFSVGVRIEHKRKYINLLQYKDKHLAETLPAADYKLSCHPGGRGVYTFCMCPGGEVVCGSSEVGGVVTNGMSYYARDMENSNSALLVSVYPEDTGEEILSGMYLQRDMESKAFEAGGGGYIAPCQRVGDFLAKRATSSPGDVKPSYLPGVRYTNLWEVLPEFVAESLRLALVELNDKMRGFCLDDALLTGVETRSSAPVRIVRDEYMCSSVKGIYPIGEGAGYAGGIMSAAMDGIKCAEIIAGMI